MFSQKINVTELKDSVRKIIFDAHKLLLENFKSMDFEKTVGSALKKCGYVYSIDTASGDFTITAGVLSFFSKCFSPS